MPSYNKVLLMGNLTRDVELKHTPSNMAVAQIGLAVNRRFKTKEGETKDEVTFVDCEARISITRCSMLEQVIFSRKLHEWIDYSRWCW